MSVLIAAGDGIVNELQFSAAAAGGARAKGCPGMAEGGSARKAFRVLSLKTGQDHGYTEMPFQTYS